MLSLDIILWRSKHRIRCRFTTFSLATEFYDSVAFYDLYSLLAEIMANITLREIHEVRRVMTDILLEGKVDHHKYTRYNLYSLRDVVHFRVSVYSANPNFEDIPAYFCASENGEILIHTPNGVSKSFIHQTLLETLSVVKEEMINLKVELKKF